ncbi:MAG: class II aldolase/adducin family protein [Paracoccaceae bacterium]|nr:class II aldolase/adducin family protein [Paracoccaceae bacterium]
MAETPKSGGLVAPELIADLAAAARILAGRGVVDGFGHVSMRHPAAADRYLMSRALAPALCTPEDILEYDLEGTAIDDGGRKSFLERFIHGEIYRARADVGAVVHSHSPSVIPFGITEARMGAMFHNAAFLAKGVPVFDIAEGFGATDMLVSDGAKGVALAEVLGDKDVALMRAHGSVACGPSLQVAVFRAVYTEVSARIQHWAEALAQGGQIDALSPEEGALADEPNQTAGMRAWELWRAEIHAETGW